MSDLISRQAAIDALHMHLMYRMGTDSNKKRLDDWINGVPSVQSEQRWIPCSERLPSEPFGCIVTVWDSTPTGEGDDFENILPYFVGWDGEQWNDEDGEKCPFEVIAWMPLPEAWKGEQNG